MFKHDYLVMHLNLVKAYFRTLGSFKVFLRKEIGTLNSNTINIFLGYNYSTFLANVIRCLTDILNVAKEIVVSKFNN